MKKAVTAIIAASAVAAAVGIGTVSFAAWEQAPEVIENNRMGTKTVIRFTEFGQSTPVVINDFWPYNEPDKKIEGADGYYVTIQFKIETGGFSGTNYDENKFILKIEILDADNINIDHAGITYDDGHNDGKTHFCATSWKEPNAVGPGGPNPAFDWINPNGGREIEYTKNDENTYIVYLMHDSNTLGDMGQTFKLKFTLLPVTKK